MSFMRGVRRALGSPPSGMERFHHYLSTFTDPAINPNLSVYPGLRARPFYDPRQFAIVPQLESAFADILREMHALEAAAAFHNETEPIKRVGAWDVLILFERGRKNDEHCELAPVTTNIVEHAATVRTLAGLTYFSRLAPGTEIAPHHGPTNLRVRCHLGLDIPAGDCGLRAGNDVQMWQTGKCLVFDDRFEHEAWNRTDAARTILVVDLWHPDLTPEEIVAIRGLHRYAFAQARNLNGYWRANEAARERKREGYD